MTCISVRALVEIAQLNPEASLELFSPEDGGVELFSDRELVIPDSISSFSYPCNTGWVYFSLLHKGD